MSANLSARELREPGLVEGVADSWSGRASIRRTIVLEITETG